MKKINIGIIGLGGIANKHIFELLKCEDAEIVAICDINPEAISAKVEKYGLHAAKQYSDYRDLIADPNVQAVEICTPNYLHAEMAIAAFNAGKPVNLEKPIAMCYKQALDILAAANDSGIVNMTCFSYRFKPAVRYAKALVDSGKLGDIVGLNVSYIKNSALWEGRRLEWRFVKEYAGSGVIGDLAVHLIDLAQLLAGNMTGLFATKSILIKQRQRLDSDEWAPVETDDQCSFIADFACGAQGTFNITRCAMGHINTIRYDVYGTKGAISFDLDHPEILDVCLGEGDPKNLTFKTVDVPEEYYLDQERAFIDALCGKTDSIFPTVSDGAQSQLIVDTILKSANEHCYVKVGK